MSLKSTENLFEVVPDGSHAQEDIDWLKSQSMLLKYQSMVENLGANSAQWQHGFGVSNPRQILEDCSVWFAAYPDSLIGESDAKVLDVLGAPALHQTLAEIGVRALHTGPMKRSGSVSSGQYGPSIDGNFDRIEQLIDPEYGTDEQYAAMVLTAGQNGITIIGDLVPGHTGKGADFRLAERNAEGFRGLFTMVEIAPEHWQLLPAVATGEDSANLSQAAAKALQEKGYAPVGPVDVEVFASPGVKSSSWSATDEVEGLDGVVRRWVYLHIYKQGQPTLNWSDPSFAAHRLLTADLLHSLRVLGVKGMRLDATMHLGIEPRAEGEPSWLARHPLSNQVVGMLGTMIRKFGGFSFQELNTDLTSISQSLTCGPEFNYDFTTRPGYLYALATGDGAPLRLMLRQMLKYGVQPSRMVHGLQNHDELMLETSHLAAHADEKFDCGTQQQSGSQIFRHILEKTVEKTTGEAAPYNQSFPMGPGVCSTLAGFIAAAQGVEDLDALDEQQVENIKRAHLLAAAFNALQGGVFLLSGWDLVGALPVTWESVSEHAADNDARWINRGGYDLLGLAEQADHSVRGLPRAQSLYGVLPEQLQDADSFASQLQALLARRQSLGISRCELIDVPDVENSGVVILINRLPADEEDVSGSTPKIQITAVNFGQYFATERINHTEFEGTAAVDWSNVEGVGHKVEIKARELSFELAPCEAKLIVIS